MKTVAAALAAHIARPVTTLCTCFRLTRQDGVVLRFTDHDRDVVVSGETYTAAVGYDRTAVENRVGAGVDNVDVRFVTFTNGGITADDIRAGLYDHASVRMFVVNWANPADGAIAIREGYVGELTVTKTGVGKGELRGLTQVFARRFIRVYSPECDADFGDERCKFDLAQVTVNGAVTSAADRRTFRAELVGIGSPSSLPSPLPAGYFDGGGLTFTAGANVGKTYEVRSQDEGIGSPPTGDPGITLFLPTPYAIQPGDTFTLYPGCGKQFEADCRDRWHNTKNFRGQPRVPGTDRLMNVTMPGDSAS